MAKMEPKTTRHQSLEHATKVLNGLMEINSIGQLPPTRLADKGSPRADFSAFFRCDCDTFDFLAWTCFFVVLTFFWSQGCWGALLGLVRRQETQETQFVGSRIGHVLTSLGQGSPKRVKRL